MEEDDIRHILKYIKRYMNILKFSTTKNPEYFEFGI